MESDRPVKSHSREWEDFIAKCKEALPAEPDEYGRMTTLVHKKHQPQQDAGEYLLQLLDQLQLLVLHALHGHLLDGTDLFLLEYVLHD